MKLEIRLHGHLEDDRKCTADFVVYVRDDDDFQKEKIKAVEEAAETASWLIETPGFPDVPQGSKVIVDRVEDLREQRKQVIEIPGAILKHIGMPPISK